MMKPSSEQLAGAVSELGAIPYFPTDSGAQLAVMSQLGKFVSGGSELRWLVDSAIAVMREWKGVPELRGLYCTKFKPVDGVETNCTLPGYTPEESEMQLAIEASNRPQLAEPAEMMALAKQKTIGPWRPRCGECEDTGMRPTQRDRQLCEWCVCPQGPRRRTADPGSVEEANAIVLKIRQRFAPTAEKADAGEETGSNRNTEQALAEA